MAPEPYIVMFSHKQVLIQRAVTITCAIVSVIVGFITLLLFCRVQKSFRHRLILLLILSDLLKSVIFAAYPLYGLFGGSYYSSGSFCQACGFLMAFALEGSDFMVLCIALHSYLGIVHKRTSVGERGLYSRRYLVYSGWILIPALLASLNFTNRWSGAFTSQGTYCYIPAKPVAYRLALSWVPRYIILLAIIGLYLGINRYVNKRFKSFNLKEAELENVRKGGHERDTLGADGDQLGGRNLSHTDGTAESSSPVESLYSFRSLDLRHSFSRYPPFLDGNTSQGNHRSESSRLQFGIHGTIRARHSRSKRSLRLLYAYPAAYLLTWIVPSINHFTSLYVISRDYKEQPFSEAATFGLACAGSALIAFQCTVDCSLFLWRERPWRINITPEQKRTDPQITRREAAPPPLTSAPPPLPPALTRPSYSRESSRTSFRSLTLHGVRDTPGRPRDEMEAEARLARERLRAEATAHWTERELRRERDRIGMLRRVESFLSVRSLSKERKPNRTWWEAEKWSEDKSSSEGAGRSNHAVPLEGGTAKSILGDEPHLEDDEIMKCEQVARPDYMNSPADDVEGLGTGWPLRI